MTINEIMEIENRCFSSPWTRDFYIRLLKDKNYYFFKIEENKEIVGYAVLMDTFELCELIKIGVVKEKRRQGLALKLLNEVFLKVKKLKRDKIILEVRKENIPALNLYENCGFEKISIRKKYYKDTGEDAVIMLKEV